MAQRHQIKTIELPEAETYVFAVLSDTHGRPHPNLFRTLDQHRPSLILHAGDIGDLDLITELETYAQTIYVRGNVDPTGPAWPDAVTVHINLGSGRISLLLLHIAVARFRLLRNARDLLAEYPSPVVIFGHSHIPFVGMDGKTCLFNSGSAGPSRMGLPITMGFIEMDTGGRPNFKHVDLATGQGWKPAAANRRI